MDHVRFPSCSSCPRFRAETPSLSSSFGTGHLQRYRTGTNPSTAQMLGMTLPILSFPGSPGALRQGQPELCSHHRCSSLAGQGLPSPAVPGRWRSVLQQTLHTTGNHIGHTEGQGCALTVGHLSPCQALQGTGPVWAVTRGGRVLVLSPGRHSPSMGPRPCSALAPGNGPPDGALQHTTEMSPRRPR